jgi:hypothetical protein
VTLPERKSYGHKWVKRFLSEIKIKTNERYKLSGIWF